MSESNELATGWIQQLELSDSVRRYFLAMDEFDWDTASKYIADQITLDAGSLAEPPREVSRADYIDALKARNGGYLTTLHLNAGHVVDIDGDSARVRANFFGAHGVGPDEADNYFAYGVYDIAMVKQQNTWKISRIAIKPVRIHGGLPHDIAARAAARYRA
ncbi:nuclear transport factor 2 family protein [Gordonia humi]|uniref:nuclear transport factor 2 family protein n=1 Tax=Gordonia humi TaxID=686429 RepID=UPI00361636CC